MGIPLEDNFSDILGKALRGLGLSESDLARQTGVSAHQIRALRNGKIDPDALRRVAPALGLDAAALLALARGEWQPETIEKIDGLAQFNTPFDDITVNSYLVWDRAARAGIAFDTGSNVTDMLALIAQEKISVKFILLTHTHGDHILELDRLKEKTGAPAFVSEKEPLDGAEPFAEGRVFEAGQLHVETRLTSGHSSGGTTYFVRGLARPLAIAGDSIFAGSMGGGMVSYRDALENNRDKVLTLPDETVICPGHGPLTTVRAEKAGNPFFASNHEG